MASFSKLLTLINRLSVFESIELPRSVRASAKVVVETFLNLKKAGHVGVVVTHDPEVANCIDKIYVIRDGEIIGEYVPNKAESIRYK